MSHLSCGAVCGEGLEGFVLLIWVLFLAFLWSLNFQVPLQR